MKKIIQFLLISLFLNTTFAGQQFKIVCRACNYEKDFLSGNSKMESIRTGISYDTFFCSSNKEFMSLPGTSSYPTKKNKEEIVKIVHSKNQIMYTHSSCKGILTNLSDYEKKGSICPVCGKGELKIINDAIVD